MKPYADYLIIGNGPAGTAAAGQIRQLDETASIMILSAESYPYYARPRLPELVRGDLGPESLTVFKESWYLTRSIDLVLETEVLSLDTVQRQVVCSTSGTPERVVGYGKLLLATGAAPFMPPIPGALSAGVLSLRTINDGLAIREAAASTGEIILIGGGLLGLELADHLADGKRQIQVIEFCDSLLPGHIMADKAALLQRILEERGFRFYLGTSCDGVRREGAEVIIHTSDGQDIRWGMVILPAGVRARTAVPAAAGIPTAKGILVDPYLETAVSGVYAAGDCIELDGRLWGFVKSALEQGKVAAVNMVEGNTRSYSGTELDIRLKVSDIDLHKLG